MGLIAVSYREKCKQNNQRAGRCVKCILQYKTKSQENALSKNQHVIQALENEVMSHV